MGKDKNKKTTCTKKRQFRYTAKEVADALGCHESYVKQVRLGTVPTKSALAQKILAFDSVLQDGSNALLKEVSRLVKI